MKAAVGAASWLGLLLTLGPPLLMYGGAMEPPAMKGLMLAGAILWFAARLLGLRDSRRAGSA
jgi:hypothetical protein